MNQINPNLQRITFFVVNFILIISYCTSTAQEITKKNNIYLELLGNGILYSINYERLVPLSEQLNLIPRVGFMYFPLTSFKSNRDYSNVSIPFELNLTWHKNPAAKNFPEVGLGLNLIGMIDSFTLDEFGSKENISTRFAKVTTFRVGFRHQKPQGGLMYRVGVLTPLTQDKFSENRVGDDVFYRLYAGFSLGYTF